MLEQQVNQYGILIGVWVLNSSTFGLDHSKLSDSFRAADLNEVAPPPFVLGCQAIRLRSS